MLTAIQCTVDCRGKKLPIYSPGREGQKAVVQAVFEFYEGCSER